MSFRMLLLAGLALAPLCGQAHAALYTFAVGQSTPFSVTATGGTDTVSFASPSGPGTFYVGTTSGLFSFSSGLGDFASFSGDPLVLTFARPIGAAVAVSIPFGIEDAFGTFSPDALTATTNTGQVVSAGTRLNALTLAEPEGVLRFVTAGPVSSITLTSANPFALASVDVPEPASAALLGTGLAGLLAARRRRR